MKKIKAACLALFLIANIFTINAFSEHVSFTSSNTDSIAHKSFNPQIASDSSTKLVYAIWQSSKNKGPIYISTTKDFGSNWEMVSIDNLGIGVNPQIATDSFGKNVYAIWDNDFDFGPIQASISQDSGNSFKAPNIGNLAAVGNYPQITTNSNGQHVYAIWQSSKTGGLIQTAISNDSGDTWKRVTIYPKKLGSFPQITTNSNGQYVYAIWENVFSGSIRMSISSDYGQNFKEVLNASFGNGKNPHIITDSSGKNVYFISEEDGLIKIYHSIDAGNSWMQANTNLIPGIKPKITIDETRRYVYAIWQTIEGFIQVISSLDFGSTWSDTFTISHGEHPQITVDSTGRFVYVVLKDNDMIKALTSLDFGQSWQMFEDGILGNGSNPHIVIDTYGRLSMSLWQDSNNELKVKIGSRNHY